MYSREENGPNGGGPGRGRPANSNPRGPSSSAGSAQEDTRGTYYKDPKEWDGRSWPPPPYVCADVVAEVRVVNVRVIRFYDFTLLKMEYILLHPCQRDNGNYAP